MGLFSLTQELAVDLGTANTLIIHNGKVVVDEPSIIAVDIHTGKVVAIGDEARKMHGKTHPDIKTIRPLKDGVIADFDMTTSMLQEWVDKIGWKVDIGMIYDAITSAVGVLHTEQGKEPVHKYDEDALQESK